MLKAYSGEGQPEKLTLEEKEVEDDFALYFQKIRPSEKGKEFVDTLWGSQIQCVTFTPGKTAYVKFLDLSGPSAFVRLVPQGGLLKSLIKGRTQSGLRLTNNVTEDDIKMTYLRARGPRVSEEEQYIQLLRDKENQKRKGMLAPGRARELIRIGLDISIVMGVLTSKRLRELEKQVRDEFPPKVQDDFSDDDTMIIHETSHNKRRSRGHRRRRA